ncbi:MAG TPA: hypothetical protein VF175_06385 [Lacipirellula sp.]
MKLPETVLCEKCGADARVITREVDDKAIHGELPVDDRRRSEGFTFRIDCPRCGERTQYLAPPP